MLPPLVEPRRAAHAAIEGYLYQTFLAVERWFDLAENEALRCEGDEDIDRLLLDGSGGVSEQIKSLSGGINIRDEVVKGTLRRFAISHHLLRQAGDRRTFVLTTTASPRRQRTRDLKVDVLAEWAAAREDGAVRDQVVAALRQTLPIAEHEEDREHVRRQMATALEWLDADPSRWADLIRSVEWRLEQPNLDGVRRRLLDRLAERGSPPDLLDRLVTEILQASIQTDPTRRVRTRDDLERFIHAAEADLIQWVAKSRVDHVRRALDEAQGIRRWLSSRHLDLNRVSPSKLLTANYEVIDFDESGRLAALEALADFANSPRARDLWIVHGDGGLGKTRLLMEGCRRLAAQSWHAGFLDPDAGVEAIAALMEGVVARLIVVDYAESRLLQVQKLVSRMTLAPPGPKVRVVLLARREGDWLRTLRRSAEEADLLDERCPSLELPPLSPDESSRWDPFSDAVHTFAAYLDVKAPERFSIPDLASEAFGRPLYLHMAALICAENRPASSEDILLEEILDRERRFWAQEIEAEHRDPERQMQLREAVESMLAVLSLGGGLDETGCRELARQLLGPGSSNALAGILVDLMRRFYAAPSETGCHLAGLEPDLLGEELVRQSLHRNVGLVDLGLAMANTAFRLHALTVLGRLAQSSRGKELAVRVLRRAFERWLSDLAELALDVAVALGDPIGQILAPIIEEKAPYEQALRLMARCDRPDFLQSVPLREVALAATYRVHEELKGRLAGAAPDLQAQFAACATQLGIRLSMLGRYEEALTVTQEAVEVYEQLTEVTPDVILPRLAFSLSCLGMRLKDLGRLDDALEAAEKAVAIRRQLVEIDVAQYQPELAASLNNLGLILNRLRGPEAALDAFQEAAEIRRALARHDDAFESDLAGSLRDLTLCWQALKQHEKAFAAIDEAEIILRRLAQDRPDAFLPDLAVCLNSRCMILSDLGRHEEALESVCEAEGIFRRLARERPDAFTPELARSLDLRGALLSATDQHEDAAVVSEEAVRILLPFFERYPRVHYEAMFKARNNYERSCFAAGRPPDSALLASLEGRVEQLER